MERVSTLRGAVPMLQQQVPTLRVAENLALEKPAPG
jgi:hypothetical protein